MERQQNSLVDLLSITARTCPGVALPLATWFNYEFNALRAVWQQVADSHAVVATLACQQWQAAAATTRQVLRRPSEQATASPTKATSGGRRI